MQKVSVHIIICFLLLFFFTGLHTGCSFPGNIYLSISWELDSDIPDLTFTCTAPNIPADIDEVVKGQYYYTHRGTYTLSYNYTDSTTMRSLDFTLEEDITIIGKENAYYDLIILKSKPPGFYKVPSDL